jgi:vitamin B12 transporter
MRVKSLLGGAIAAISLSVLAEDAPTSDFDPVVVTATRTETLLSETLSPVTVITREEIDRSPGGDITSLLRFHAGLDVARTGGPGSPASVFIRGGNSNHSLVLIDGVRMNNGTLGRPALEHISLESIDRIEIVKGPRSTLHGSQAIGGVINIITRDAPEGTRLQARVGTGRWDTREAAATVTYRSGDTRLSLSAEHESTDGFPPFRDSGIDRGHDNTSFNLKAGQDFDTLRMGVRAWQAKGNSEYLDPWASFPEFTPRDQDFLNRVGAVDLSFDFGRGGLLRADLSHATDDLHQNQSEDFARTRRNVLDLQHDWQASDVWQMVSGIYLSRERTEALSFGSGYDERTDSDELFVQNRFDLDAQELIVAARYIDNEAFGSETTWNLDYGVEVGARTRLVAGAGTAFRTPDATSRFGAGFGNPDLQPESSRNIELGYRKLIGDHQGVELSLFENRIENLIAFDGNTFRMENIEEARIRGIEVSHRLTRDRWHWRNALVLQDPEDRQRNEQLPRRSKRSFTSSLSYGLEHMRFGASLLYTGSRPDSAFNDEILDAYTLLNLDAGFDFGRQWTLQLELENLADEDYETAFGYNSPGRSLFARLIYRSGG